MCPFGCPFHLALIVTQKTTLTNSRSLNVGFQQALEAPPDNYSGVCNSK
jgi:hypothetical protein